MIRRFTLGFNTIPLRFAAATLFMLGCSASAEEPTANGGSGPGPSGGTGNGGAGGGLTPLAGQPSIPVFGGSGGSGSAGRPGASGGTGTAGTPGAAGSMSGGVPGVAGAMGVAGAAVAGAAPVAGTGAGGATTCDTYSGTAKTPSVIFSSGYGTSTKGAWQGYAYTFSFGTGVTVHPGSSTTMSCFPMMQMCSNGSVPAADTAGAGIGWSINQMKGGTAGAVAITTPVNFQLKGATAGMRVGLVPAVGEMEFCYTLLATDVTTAASASGLTVALTDFKSQCYDTAKATPYAGEMIKAIQVSVPGSAAAAKTFDYCIIDIEPGG